MKREGSTEFCSYGARGTWSVEPDATGTDGRLDVLRPPSSLKHLEIFFALGLHPHQTLDRLAGCRTSRIRDDGKRHF